MRKDMCELKIDLASFWCIRSERMEHADEELYLVASEERNSWSRNSSQTLRKELGPTNAAAACCCHCTSQNLSSSQGPFIIHIRIFWEVYKNSWKVTTKIHPLCPLELCHPFYWDTCRIETIPTFFYLNFQNVGIDNAWRNQQAIITYITYLLLTF